MLKEIRRDEVIRILEEKKKSTITELLDRFNVSLSTIHRDLDILEREGRIKKIHGGVLLNIIEDIETRNIIRLRTNIELKKNIAEKALEYIEDNDCIFIDNSTTCFYFAEKLSKLNKNIIIITNSNIIPSLFINNEKIQVVSTGGLLLKELNCFTGPGSIININEFNGNKFFFSTAAISIKGELTDLYRPDSDEIKRAMLERSKNHICLVDSTKFNKIGQSKVFLLSEVTTIITDKGCSAKVRQEFLKKGRDLVIA